MAKRTITIKLNDATKEFYHNMFLAHKLKKWVEMFKALHALYCNGECEYSDEDCVLALKDKEVAKSHLAAVDYEEYIKYYDDIYVRG